MNRLVEARAHASQASEELRVQNDRMQESSTRTILAAILNSAREHEAAEREARRAAELVVEDSPFGPEAQAMLAEALLGLGRPLEARDVVAEVAVRIADRPHLTWACPTIYRVHAETLRATGDLDGARKAVACGRAVILERADRFRDQQWREAFLALPQNKKLCALALALDVG